MGEEFDRSPRERGGITLTTIMTKILEFLKCTQEEYNVGTIATRIREKKATVRVYLWRLEKEGLLSKTKKGRDNFYSLPTNPPYEPARPKQVKFHGFTIKCTTPQKCVNTSGDDWKEDLYLFSDSQNKITVECHMVGTTPKRAGGQWMGRMRVQNKGGRNLMVQYGSTGRSLTAEEFQAFCEGVGRRFGCEVWGGWPEWGLVQVGYGIDELIRQNHDALPWCMTIKDFVGNVWRSYKKEMPDGTHVKRGEFHPHWEEPVPMDLATQIQTVNAAIQGGVQVMAGVNAQALFTRQVSTKIDGLVNTMNQVMGLLVEVLKQNGGGR